jgi:predicted methyltransferase
MAIEHFKGGTTITGSSIDFYRLCAFKHAVALEIAGIKMRRGPVVWKQAAREFSVKGTREAVYAWLCAEVERQRPLQQHVVRD